MVNTPPTASHRRLPAAAPPRGTTASVAHYFPSSRRGDGGFPPCQLQTCGGATSCAAWRRRRATTTWPGQGMLEPSQRAPPQGEGGVGCGGVTVLPALHGPTPSGPYTLSGPFGCRGQVLRLAKGQSQADSSPPQSHASHCPSWQSQNQPRGPSGRGAYSPSAQCPPPSHHDYYSEPANPWPAHRSKAAAAALHAWHSFSMWRLLLR